MPRRPKTSLLTGTDASTPAGAQSSEPPASQEPSAAPSTGSSSPPKSPEPWMLLIQLSGASPSNDQLKALVHEQITRDLAEDPISAKYNIMFLYDAVAIARS